ncbi:MAG: 50S ribosomal L9 C-terminal domain-containing protein, partial [Sphingomicrobium sp.]
VKLIRQASNTGQLYGSVSARDIIEALGTDGAKLVKSQIVLDRPIKAIGVHEVKVVLHPEVTATVKVNVARSPEEADLQAQGIDVMAAMFERDAGVTAEDLAPEAPATEEPVAAEAEAAAEPAAEAEEAPAEAAAEPAAELTDEDKGE